MLKIVLAAAGGVLLASLLSGCPTMIIGGAAQTAAIAHDRRTTGTYLEDQEIEIKALKAFYGDPEVKDHSSISTTSYNLNVLLTGQAKSAEVSARFARQVAELPRVKKVYNEVVVGPEGTLEEAANDAYLTTKAKYALLDVEVPGFDPTRVKVVTSQGTVYLMGLVTAAEADDAVDKVRRVSGVQRVVRVFEIIPPGALPPPESAPSSEPAPDTAVH